MTLAKKPVLHMGGEDISEISVER